MTATHATTDRSLSVTTRNLRRRASTQPAEANHQVGTPLSRRHPAPAPTLSLRPPTPQNHPLLPRVTATPPAGSPTPPPGLPLSASPPLLFSSDSSLTLSLSSLHPLHSPSRLSTNTS